MNKPITIIIILIITALIGVLFLWPAYQESTMVLATLGQKQARYDNDLMYYAKVADLSEVIDAKRGELEIVNTALPSRFSVAPLVNFFQKKGTEARLQVVSVGLSQVSPVVSGKELKQAVFAVNVVGSYQSLKQFLFSLDRSERLFEVNTISFNPIAAQGTQPGNTQTSLYDIKLEVKTYTY